jgi:hypothetical protein
MKRSLKNLSDFSIETLDGAKGKIKDILIDEDTWIIRYIEADFGNILRPDRKLIPGIYFGQPAWLHKNLPVDITLEQIEKSPVPDSDKPISKKYEEMLSQYYEYAWPWAYTIPPGTVGYYPSNLVQEEKIPADAESITGLRSFNEIKGYNIIAVDGKLGKLVDIIADDSEWQISYIIADTSWLPWSKSVILSVHWLKTISYLKRELSLDLQTETIRNAPEYDAEYPFASDFEEALFDHYRKHPVNLK